jgi:putative endonuclease
MSNKYYWVYILHCDNNSYYTGYTTDLVNRYHSHLKGTASKYTRSFKPLSMIQCWKIVGDKSLAMQVERYIKKLSRAQKENLIAFPSILAQLYQKLV